jgi:hypothetical protein
LVWSLAQQYPIPDIEQIAPVRFDGRDTRAE